MGYRPAPAPVVYKPAPVVYKPAPAPIVYKPAPQPIAYKPAPAATYHEPEYAYGDAVYTWSMLSRTTTQAMTLATRRAEMVPMLMASTTCPFLTAVCRP